MRRHLIQPILTAARAVPVVLVVGFGLCLSSVQAADPKDKGGAARVAEDNFAFGCDLYKTLAKDRGNPIVVGSIFAWRGLL